MDSTDWVSIRDRFPDERDDIVIIHTPDDETDPVWFGFYDHPYWHTIDGYQIEGRVSHWMKLPTPPPL